jgi:hypothetical protein
LARACASVRPTVPIWGSVKVTRGSAFTGYVTD